MNMQKWWPYVVIGIAALIVSIGYPIYFKKWDHSTCRDSGGTYSDAQNKCIEPRGADIPKTEGSKSFEDDNQGGAKPRE